MEHIQEATDKIKTALPAGFNVHEFAIVIAHTLFDEYGEHNIERFISTLKNELDEINPQHNANAN